MLIRYCLALPCHRRDRVLQSFPEMKGSVWQCQALDMLTALRLPQLPAGLLTGWGSVVQENAGGRSVEPRRLRVRSLDSLRYPVKGNYAFNNKSTYSVFGSELSKAVESAKKCHGEVAAGLSGVLAPGRR